MGNVKRKSKATESGVILGDSGARDALDANLAEFGRLFGGRQALCVSLFVPKHIADLGTARDVLHERVVVVPRASAEAVARGIETLCDRIEADAAACGTSAGRMQEAFADAIAGVIAKKSLGYQTGMLHALQRVVGKEYETSGGDATRAPNGADAVRPTIAAATKQPAKRQRGAGRTATKSAARKLV